MTPDIIQKYGGEFAMKWFTENNKCKFNYNFDMALLTIEIKCPLQ